MSRKTLPATLALLLALGSATLTSPAPAFADAAADRPFYSRWWDRLLGRSAPAPAAEEAAPPESPSELPLDTKAQRAAALKRAEARYATDMENASSLPPYEAEAERERALRRYHEAYRRIEKRAVEAESAARHRALSERRAQGFRDGSASDETDYADGEADE